MTEEQADFMEYEFDNVEKYEGTYSGRGMYGEGTHAVTCDSLADFHNDLGNYIINYAAVASNEELQLLGDALSGLREDSLGRGIILY